MAEHTEEYTSLRSVAFMVITVYTLLVPLFFFSLLWRVRDFIMAGKQTRLTRSLFFLHGACELAPAWLTSDEPCVCDIPARV